MAALIRRSVLTSFLAALTLLVGVAPAWAQTATTQADAGGRAVLADYEDNGQIDGCYTMAQYEDALKLIRPDQQQYGAAVDVIRAAEYTNLQRPGEACASASAASSVVQVDDGGIPIVLWVIVGVAAVVIVAGMAMLLTRGKRN